MSIEQDVSIDKYHLDDEAKTLPSLIGKYHDRIFDKTQLLVELELQLEKEEAVARKHIREKFIAEGKKFTVDSVNDEVAMMESLMHLRRQVADNKTEITYLKGVLAALDAKKSSLNNLVSLYVRDYGASKVEEDGRYREADVVYSNGESTRRTEELNLVRR